MQTNSILVSFLASGLGAASAKSYTTPVECTPPAVAYSTPAYSTPAYASPSASTMSFEQYGSPSVPSAPHVNSSPKPYTKETYTKETYTAKEYTPNSSHVTIKVAETPSCTTSGYPHQSSGYPHLSAGMHTTTSCTTSTTGTSKMTTYATPTHSTVQGVASHMDAHGVFIATVVAGLFLFM